VQSGNRSVGRPTSIPLAGSSVAPISVILPLETSLLTFPDFVPPGCGVEVLNDDSTPMEFVVSMLSAQLGLDRKGTIRAMLAIHTKGGALLATPTRAAAEAAARAITTPTGPRVDSANRFDSDSYSVSPVSSTDVQSIVRKYYRVLISPRR
jgi:hypothetical protein